MSGLIAVRQSGPIGARTVEIIMLAQGAAFDLTGDIALNSAHRAIVAGNPHGTTAAQVGADPAGSAATVQGNLNTHTADLANPHQVTGPQVGFSEALYALLAGRSGGQTLQGGTDSGDDLTLESTSHATKGNIDLGGFATIGPQGKQVITATLDDATGDEVALSLNYATNKATSGDDTGLQINMTDATSPGTSLPLDVLVGGVSKFRVNSAGNVIAVGLIVSDSITPSDNNETQTLNSRSYTVADTAIRAVTGGVSNSSGQFVGFNVRPTYNQSGTASATDLLINRTENAVGSGAQLLADFQVGSISKCNIDNNGDILNTNGVYGTISDEKLKENITDATPKLADLLKIQVRNFNFKGDKLKQLGVIAQEIETIFPALIIDKADTELIPDAEWEPAPAETDIAPAVFEERQKVVITKEQQKRTEINLVDGRYVQQEITESIDIKAPVFDEHELFNEAGELIGVHRAPVMGKVEVSPEKTVIIKEAETEADRPMIATPTGTTTKSVKYSILVPMLVKAVQELSAEIDAIKESP